MTYAASYSRRSRLVALFHDKFKHPINDHIGHPDMQVEKLRMKLLREEFNEYLAAVRDRNIVEIADALADMAVIIEGTALAYGIPLEAVFNEVMRANFSKLDAYGNPIYREDGKIEKGPNYEPPNIAKVLRNWGWKG